MDQRSARAALIFAAEAADTGSTLRATVPFLGATLIEHQVRQAVAAGAGHVVVLVGTMPPDLLAALDRLRRDGVAVEVARSLGDAADRMHPDERILLFADGCLSDQPLAERMADAPAPALLVVPSAASPAFERIDAAHGWGGLATLDGALARHVATLPGEWDAQSVLLRRLVQAGARRIETDDSPRLLREPVAEGVPSSRLAASRTTTGAWTSRWLFPLVEVPLVRLLGSRPVDPFWLAIAAAALGVLALPVAAAGWPGVALALLLLSGPLGSSATRLARLRLGRVRFGPLLGRIRASGAAAALLWVSAQLGERLWPLAALIAILAQLAAARETAMLRRRGEAVPAAVADVDALAWSALGGLLVAGWPGAVALTALYATASFALVQDRLSRAV
ncbi:hypothetical protein [Sphingomonas jatrophae]|uniref:Uncharacterized protein n=1 Tax=Sphingomonas jatrophae TaxID=1166337 RepID=A0A1I6JV41_9SPHN|nr:hypothetical protein [Sphingomonas jatrophae]SFR82827.1 hypothetical protein SAMN05192580_0925 [Sphingomonas jatrophae]